ncbi:MAG: hypothetical protein A3J74_10645 [Elusimicrobia bacterium RIFCSPHIGHO2_02_FULL_57_9]|nr:MAG: hypothetical protein A3J74_10645 [Elusimicrobia bacterium RIFCSPHIGHO2_02_FULL_57_9]
MMVTHWRGKRARAEEVEIYHAPNNRKRREFIAPDGRILRMIISDGESEQVHWLKSGKTLRGDAVKSYEKLMSPEKERELLLKNYSLAVSGPDKVAGRFAWVLEFKPLVSGKPHQQLWIDRQTGVILANKRLLPKKSFAVLSRFSRFEPRKTLDDSLFRLDAASAGAVSGHGLEPDFMSLEELNEATGKTMRFPADLPGGFVFESADFFDIGKQVIRHLRYTDGLAVISLFQTQRPVKPPKQPDLQTGDGAGSLRLSGASRVLAWKRKKQYFTLMGDVSGEILGNISSSLK